MTYRLQRRQQLSCDLDTAWQFFSTPNNLSRITPTEMRFKVIGEIPDGTIYTGMTIDYTVSPMLGIPMHWRTMITQVNEQKSFTDYQQKGPYKLWNHFHEFIANEQGVLMIDTVDYELPFGKIGVLVHSLFVRKKLEQIFDYRYHILETLFNTQNSTK